MLKTDQMGVLLGFEKISLPYCFNRKPCLSSCNLCNSLEKLCCSSSVTQSMVKTDTHNKAPALEAGYLFFFQNECDHFSEIMFDFNGSIKIIGITAEEEEKVYLKYERWYFVDFCSERNLKEQLLKRRLQLLQFAEQ